MTGDVNQEARKPKKPYTRPAFKKVPLKPEEAVLAFCKTSGGGGGPLQSNCHSPSNCSSLGT